jgi:hypothetical protein
MTINVRIRPDGEFVPVKVEKDPTDVIDLVVDYSQYFKTDDITTTTVTGQSVTIDSSAEAANVVTIWISAGTNGTNGEVKIVTSSATRTLERTIIVIVENK